MAFYLLLILELFPIWAFRYFPSSDGPSHLYNSFVFLNYRRVPVFEQAFTLHIPTAGNLAGHGLAILLMRIGLPPEICEKLIISLCIIGLALAFRYAVASTGISHPLAPLLVMPFLYNWPLQMGFWSFNLGVPFVLVCMGLCLRYRGGWNARRLTWLFLAVAAAYLCHPIDWAVCGFVVASMTVAAEWRAWFQAPSRKRAAVQTVLPVCVFIPFAIPNLLFARQNERMIWDRFVSIRSLLWPIYTDAPLHLFQGDEGPAKVLFLFLALTSLAHGAWKARARKIGYLDVLLALAVGLFAMGLASPGWIGEGSFLEVRLLLFGYVVWALWLGLTVAPRAAPALAWITVLISLWLIAARLPGWKAANHQLADVVKLSSTIPPGSFVCELDLHGQTNLVPPMEHAIDLLPDRKILDVRDYEAGRRAFWTRFRPGYFLDQDYSAPATEEDFEKAVETFQTKTGRNVDYLVLTDLKAPSEQVVRKMLPNLAGRYELVAAQEPTVAIYRYENSKASNARAAAR